MENMQDEQRKAALYHIGAEEIAEIDTTGIFVIYNYEFIFSLTVKLLFSLSVME